MQLRLVGLGLLALMAVSCGSPEPGEVLVRVEGSVSSLVTTVPEATTTTVAGTQTTTSLPGLDPGACPAPGGIVVVALVEELQAADPCPVGTEGQLQFSNFTDEDVTVEWGDDQITVPAQRSFVPTELVGEVLSPGLHAFVTSIEATPTVQVAAIDSGFGVAQVGLRTFGGIRPGQRVTEAEEAVGVSIVIADRGARCSLGWIAGDPHSPLLALDATGIDPIILRADATTSRQLTLSEVGIGSRLSALEDAYGDQLAEGDGGLYVFEPNEAIDASFRLVFQVEDGGDEPTVTAMRIGRLGEVERTAPCP